MSPTCSQGTRSIYKNLFCLYIPATKKNKHKMKKITIIFKLILKYSAIKGENNLYTKIERYTMVWSLKCDVMYVLVFKS